ncbi:MAG: hypothetical protein EGR89_04335, partial [[Eubacterium] rectale]|nr:hypothetical protein [Agathobacter rectalis]
VRDAITLLNYGFGKCQKYTEKKQKGAHSRDDSTDIYSGCDYGIWRWNFEKIYRISNESRNTGNDSICCDNACRRMQCGRA